MLENIEDNPVRVLMVDDDEHYIAMCRKVLESPDALKNYYHELIRSFEPDEFELRVEKRNGLENFRQKSLNVAGVNSGKACLEQLDIINPHVIILDYHMPEMNGMQLFHQLQTVYTERKQKDPTIYMPPIIILSSNEDGDLVLEMARQGIEFYVEKGPKDITAILSILSTGYFFNNL